MDARKRIMTANKTAAELELAKEQDALGPTGCVACMAYTCEWKSSVDRKAVNLRLQSIADEINFVRENPTLDVVDRWGRGPASRTQTCGRHGLVES